MLIDCEFSNPVNWLGTPPIEYEMWNFKNATCDVDVFTLIENQETGADFYIQKTIDYGQVFLILCVLIVLIFGIAKAIGKFIFK